MRNNPDPRPGGSTSSGLITEQVQQQTQQVARQAQQTAGQVADRALAQTTSALESQKGRATQTLHSVVDALHQTSQNLQSQNQGGIGQMTDKAAQQIESVCGYLEARSVNDLIVEGENFARRNSAVFLTGAFAVGLLAARFLKSSPPGHQQSGTASANAAYPNYSYHNVPYGQEEIGGTPDVGREYAGGLKTVESEVRVGDGA